MSLLQDIKDHQLEARKKKDKIRANLLTTLLGEASMIGKNDGNRETTDNEVVAVIKKFIKSMNETMQATDGGSTQLLSEKAMLEEYLPEQLTGNALHNTITSIVINLGAHGPKAMGMVMKELKTQYAGQYDGKEASTLTKEVLGK